jgi:hypothetical protein
MVDITHPAMQPLYDPVRSLVYAAGERAIRHVFVGGQQVVCDGKALAFDYADTSAPGSKWRNAARSKGCRFSIGPGAVPPRSCRQPSRPGELPPHLVRSRMRRPENPAAIAQLWSASLPPRRRLLRPLWLS